MTATDPSPRRPLTRPAALIALVAFGAGAIGWTAASNSDTNSPAVASATAPSGTKNPEPDSPVPADNAATSATVQCTALLAELVAREDSGQMKYDEDEMELTDEQYEQLDVPASDFDGSVATEGGARTGATFGGSLDVANLTDEGLQLSTEHCFEAGILADNETDETDDIDENGGQADDEDTGDDSDASEDNEADD